MRSRVRHLRQAVLLAAVPCAVAALAAAPLAVATTTQRVSVSSEGAQADGPSIETAISADGRWIAFSSTAADLVRADTNGRQDVFVHDRVDGTTERVSVGTGGGQATDDSETPAISADGRFVAFASRARLVPGTTGRQSDIFVRDRATGRTTLVSVGRDGARSGGDSREPSISADGRRVAFASLAANLVPGDTNGEADVFVRDLAAGTTRRVSVASGGGQRGTDPTFFPGRSGQPAISADGRHVAFFSTFAGLVPGPPTEAAEDVFVHDIANRRTVRVSAPAADAYSIGSPSISANGRFVAFDRAEMGPDQPRILVWDRATRRTEDVSAVPGADVFAFTPSISANGRFVVFEWLDDEAAGAPGLGRGVFVRDRATGAFEQVSVDDRGAPSAAAADYASPGISADGRFAVFASDAGDLVPGDTNGVWDAFVRGPLAHGPRACTPATPGWSRGTQAVDRYLPGRRKDGTPVDAGRSDPVMALGRPQLGAAGVHSVSLGFGGRVEICFSPDVRVPREGRVRIWEDATPGETFATHPERVRVEVSSDGRAYALAGVTSARDQSYRLPRLAGGVRFVRLTDVTDPYRFGPEADGFDVNAVVLQTREGARLAP